MDGDGPLIEIGTRRLALAAVVAPLVSVIIPALLIVIRAVLTLDLSPMETLALTQHSVFSFLLVGAPFAYLVAALAGVPAYLMLRRSDRLTAGWVIGIATVCGTVSMPIIWQWYTNGQSNWMTLLLGSAAGFVAGALFWGIGISGRWAGDFQF
jgi:hypothetical protein